MTMNWCRVGLRVHLVVLLILLPVIAVQAEDTSSIQIGIVTDVHAHDTDSPVENKVMTNYAERLAAFADAMNAWPADAVFQLGDLINGAFVMGAPIGDVSRIRGLLDEALLVLSAHQSPIYHVLGNHDMYNLSKPEVLDAFGLEVGYYSLDIGAFHFVALDAEFNPDGTDYDHVFMRTKGFIPPEQLDWLASDLAATTRPTLVLVHQPIDSNFESLAGGPPIVNNEEVQRVLSNSGAVIAVFQGHDHENRHVVIDGIHYVTFDEMVDHTESVPPTYAKVTLDPVARLIQIEGFGRQESYELSY